MDLWIETMLPALLAALPGDRPFTLILDGLEHVTDDDAVTSLGEFIVRLPAGMRVVAATFEDDRNFAQARTKCPARSHMYSSAPMPVAANTTSRQVRFFIDMAIRTLSSTATTGGISHSGENSKAWMDSAPASSMTNAIRVKILVAMPRFSAQRSRRFGWNG